MTSMFVAYSIFKIRLNRERRFPKKFDILPILADVIVDLTKSE